MCVSLSVCGKLQQSWRTLSFLCQKGRLSQLWLSFCSWFTDRHQRYHSDLSVSFFLCLSLSVSSLSLYVPVHIRVYVPIHVYVLMACVFTCITPHVIYIYLSHLFTYTSPRTTLFNSKPFISLKNFNMLPVSFLCISLTTGNLVIRWPEHCDF